MLNQMAQKYTQYKLTSKDALGIFFVVRAPFYVVRATNAIFK